MTKSLLLALGALIASAGWALAQSPNTAALVVSIQDQTGAVVSGAQVTATNVDTGVVRTATSGNDGTVTLSALPINGTYTVSVAKQGFTAEDLKGVLLRGGETATVRVRLVASGGTSEVTVYGTVSGVRNDPELGTRLDASIVDQTPLLGRKISYLPLLNAAFRPAKGTGDLFMNSIYVVTGAGGRREADFIVDGASGDEPWGRQTMFSTIPVAAVQEMNIMSRAFSAEFGWTASAGINIVTKAGSNATHGEVMYLGRPGGAQPKTFSAAQQCPSSVPTCIPPVANGAPVPLVPPDIPDSLNQGSFSLGGAFVPDRTHYFVAADFTGQNRTAAVTSPLVPAGTTVVGTYRQALVDGRVDHKVNANHALMARFNLDRFYDTNPQDTVSGNVLPSAGRRFTRHSWTAQLNETAVLSDSMLNEARVEYQSADPVTAFDPLTPSTQFTRAGSVPFTAGESRFAHVYSRVGQFSDTLSWTTGRHYLRFGGSVARNTSGGDGTEFGSAFVLGQFTVTASTTQPPDQLTLGDMQRYQQSFNLGKGTYVLNQWISTLFVQDSFRATTDLTLDLGVRYDNQTFSDSKDDFAPRVGFGWNPAGDPKTSVRGGYGLYTTMLRANNAANFELGGPQGVFTYTATPGQTGFPSCLTCTPVPFDATTAASSLPARNITIRPGMASFYSQFFDVSRLPELRERDIREPAQPGWVDRHRARAGAPPVLVHRLREAALDRSRPDRGPERAFTLRANRARTGPQRRGRGCDSRHRAGQRRLPADQRDRERRRCRLRRPADDAAVAERPQRRVGELHALEGDEHDRAGRQRRRPERLQSARRGRARPESARPAAPRRNLRRAIGCRSTSRQAPSPRWHQRAPSIPRLASTTTATATTTIVP